MRTGTGSCFTLPGDLRWNRLSLRSLSTGLTGVQNDPGPLVKDDPGFYMVLLILKYLLYHLNSSGHFAGTHIHRYLWLADYIADSNRFQYTGGTVETRHIYHAERISIAAAIRGALKNGISPSGNPAHIGSVQLHNGALAKHQLPVQVQCFLFHDLWIK